MAVVTITLTDTPEGFVFGEMRSDPDPVEGEQLTPAQEAGLDALYAIGLEILNANDEE